VIYVLRCEAGAADLYPTYVLLPLALASFLTATLFSVQWLVQLFADHDQRPEKHHTSSQGAEQ
jgi:hypothetical protein